MCTLYSEKFEFTNARAGNPPRKGRHKKIRKVISSALSHIYAAGHLFSSRHGTSFYVPFHVLSCAPRVPEDDVQAREADGGVRGAGLGGGGPRLPLPLLPAPLHPHVQRPHLEGKVVRKTGYVGCGGWQRGQRKEFSYLLFLLDKRT
jgi:hypothetical protein